MNTKKVSLLVVLVIAAVLALPLQAQSVYSYGYHGTTGFSSSELTGQLAIDGARLSLGNVQGMPSNPLHAKEDAAMVQQVEDEYRQNMADRDAEIKAIMAKSDAEYEKAMKKYRAQEAASGGH